MSLNSLLKKIICYIPNRIYDAISLRQIIKLGDSCDKSDLITITFIVQMPQIWDKQVLLYEQLKQDSRFDINMVVIPEYDLVNKEVKTSYKDNYFLDNYKEAIRAWDGDHWINLKSLGSQYVFFQRPYDQYLPTGFRSKDVAKYSRCCYIPYGYAGADVFNGGNTNRAFFRNIYFVFIESDYMKKLLRKKFKNKAYHIESVGYPSLIPYFSLGKTSEFKRFLWTPRWSYDKRIGGSNFLKYKDLIVDIQRNNPDIKIVFRPHPLLFDELINKQLMTQDEIDVYLKTINEVGISYDCNTPLFDQLKNTDVLITDYSSVIIEFFLTGRPIIYCDGGIELNAEYLKLKKTIYTAYSEEDILNYVSNLINNNDIRADERRLLIDNYRIIHENATNNIIECIVRDEKERGE